MNFFGKFMQGIRRPLSRAYELKSHRGISGYNGSGVSCNFVHNSQTSTSWGSDTILYRRFSTLRPKDLKLTVSKAEPQNEQEMLKVAWTSGDSDAYPYIWLRDNCQCSECFHESSQSRHVQIKDLSLSVRPISVDVKSQGESVEIQWSDGHVGLYPVYWLKERCFTESSRQRRQENIRFHRSYWNADMAKCIPKATFGELLCSDEALLNFLRQLEELGLVIVSRAPCESGQLVTLSNKIGFIKQTHYGNVFSVKQKVDANNLAYTESTLDLHVDMPYLHCSPEIQLLHCIEQTTGEGGENQLVDSFHAANKLRQLHPDKFEILANTNIDFHDIGVETGLEFHAINQKPMIALNRFGEVTAVYFNQMVRDSYLDLPAEKVRCWYDAMITFHNILCNPENVITYKMKDGDILVFDNCRVLHGRKGFRMTEGNRQLEGCYWDWDIVKSCRRVLENALKI